MPTPWLWKLYGYRLWYRFVTGQRYTARVAAQTYDAYIAPSRFTGHSTDGHKSEVFI
jgi:hypothetical protein